MSVNTVMREERMSLFKSIKFKCLCGSTEHRYLDCDSCREKKKQCIEVCCGCGKEIKLRGGKWTEKLQKNISKQ